MKTPTSHPVGVFMCNPRWNAADIGEVTYSAPNDEEIDNVVSLTAAISADRRDASERRRAVSGLPDDGEVTYIRTPEEHLDFVWEVARNHRGQG